MGSRAGGDTSGSRETCIRARGEGKSLGWGDEAGEKGLGPRQIVGRACRGGGEGGAKHSSKALGLSIWGRAAIRISRADLEATEWCLGQWARMPMGIWGLREGPGQRQG